jgi:SAM-dependent methyltransferase
MSMPQPSSASLDHPDYWWYRARAELLRSALADAAGRPHRLLDVGSADGPSVEWLTADHRVAIDLDPRGLTAGGVCGSVLALPFHESVFDVVCAFDVLEHCDPEAGALAEMTRVLAPQGRLLLSVPAYQWAWTDFDVAAGHVRRYTRGRLVGAVESAGLRVVRVSHIFASTLPAFVAERLARRVRPRPGGDPPALPEVHPLVESGLLAACRAESRLVRRHDLPFGSSVVLAAVKG